MIHDWPNGEFITICCLDGYEPQLARDVIAAVNEVHDSETVAIVVKVMVQVAKLELSWN